MKTCSACGEEKSIEDFPKGRHNQCRKCRAAAMKKWRENNPDYRREYAEAERVSGKKYLRNRATKFKTKYGITVEEFDALLVAQDGRCRICRKILKTYAFGEGKGCRDDYAVVDHDHVTGHVRGILCVGCNLLLGYADDDPALLARAIEYLKETVE